MPLQNRVTPEGEIIATPHRGLMMGNRGGAFHLPDQTLRPRRWATRQWIACVLEFKGRHRAAMMQPNRYTELFFLDEATALAAGHRPCFECRRARRRALRGAVGAGRTGGPRAARAPRDGRGAACRARRRPRAGKSPIARSSRRLPDGAFVRYAATAARAQPYLVDRQSSFGLGVRRLRDGVSRPSAARGGGADAALHRCRTFSRISSHAAPLGRGLAGLELAFWGITAMTRSTLKRSAAAHLCAARPGARHLVPRQDRRPHAGAWPAPASRSSSRTSTSTCATCRC